MDWGGSVSICALKQLQKGWASLGCVAALAPFQKSFELRHVTSSAAQDIVVHSDGSGCGGGYCAGSLTVLHIAVGRLHRVFETEDRVSAWCFIQETRVRLPDDRPVDPGFIVVEHHA